MTWWERQFSLHIYSTSWTPFGVARSQQLILGALVGAAGTAVGYLFAFAIARADVPWKGFFRIIATFPIISPPFVLSLAAILLLGRQGFITRTVFQGWWDPHIYGLRGLILVETIAFFPTAFLIMLGVLQAIDPALEESSLNLGATRWQVFWTVPCPWHPGQWLLLVVFIDPGRLATPSSSGNFHPLGEAYLHIAGMADFPGRRPAVLLCPKAGRFFLRSTG
jgi:iron(III) transport system permease protein